MKEIWMMVLPGCPYCRQAETLLEELMEENPAYRALSVRSINERKEKALADSLDYYFVPTFFVDGEKLMEGVPDKAAVKAVLDRAMEE